MTKTTISTTNNADETLNRFKAMTTIQHIDLVISAVDAVMDNITKTAKHQNEAYKEASNQLRALIAALKDYAEPVTEEFWDKVLRPSVSEHLRELSDNGHPRYKSDASRDVMVNLFKVATMGITLMRHDRAFIPSQNARENMKKYADEVRPLLQKAIDPETGKPRLRSIAQPERPKIKRLPEDTYYWLIGIEAETAGRPAANSVLGKDVSLDGLVDTAKYCASKYPQYVRFNYCIGKMNGIDLKAFNKQPEEPDLSNAAIFGQTIKAA